MSKFLNYVKKFLSLSFMSAIAAFSLSFNQVSAEVSMSDIRGLPISRIRPRNAYYKSPVAYVGNQHSEVVRSIHDKDKPQPLQVVVYPLASTAGNNVRAPASELGLLSLASSNNHLNMYKDDETGNVYSIRETENESGEIKREATWIGNFSSNIANVAAEIASSETEDQMIPVTGADLGSIMGTNENDEHVVKKLVMDATNYDDGIENIKVTNMDIMPSLTKIEISNLNSEHLSFPNLVKSILTQLLTKNSLNGSAAWYTEGSGNNEKLIGESNLSWGQLHGGHVVHVQGVDYKRNPVSGSWNLVSLANQSTVVIPASFVDDEARLQKVDGLDLPNGIETDKIQKIVITNIQDDEQKEKIIKCAKLALPGLENGLNDEMDWILSPEQSGDVGTLIFQKVTRDIKSIIIDVVKDYQDWFGGHKNDSLSLAEKVEEFKKILDRRFERASENGIKIKNIFKTMLDSLEENGTLEIVDNMQQSFKQIIDSIAQGNEYSYSDIDWYDKGSSYSRNEINQILEIFKKISSYTIGNDGQLMDVENVIKDLDERLKSILKELESDSSDYEESSYSDYEESSYSDEDFSSDESTSSGTGSLTLQSGTDDSLTRPDPQHIYDASEDNSSSESGSTENKNNSSNVLGSSSSNSVNETNDNVSKLTTVLQDWQNWLVGDGADKNAKEKYQELKNMINAQMDSLSTEEKEEAKKLIKEIDDALADIDSASSSSTGSSTGTASTSTYSSTPSSSSSNSAQTKTSDSCVSPEFLSLILSGSLAGLGISLKKRDE